MSDSIKGSKNPSSGSESVSDLSANRNDVSNHSSNSLLRKRRMSVENKTKQGGQKGEHIDQVFDYSTAQSEWIDRLEDVLGEAQYVLRLEEEPETAHETASYFLPSGVVDEPSFGDNHVTLNITRPLVGRRLYFRANIRIVKDGEQILYSYPQVIRLAVCTNRKSVLFFDVSVGEQEPVVELFASGKVDVLK